MARGGWGVGDNGDVCWVRFLGCRNVEVVNVGGVLFYGFIVKGDGLGLGYSRGVVRRERFR